ncbi:type II toxin-antitoxin system VapC family toxin [Humibacter sp.]|jgi:predicted nucleic acid-binding protein|uniref:type II toxin-antitoxin system VapC family toxin n=1 Tax=Humibacter sp. TaxID=1940291 RepID=UPI003F810E3D
MILVDSDVLIAHLRGYEPAHAWLRNARVSGPLSISVVTIAEISGGMRSGERREVWRLLDAFQAEPVSELVARRAGELRRRFHRSHSGIGLADYLIAATADVHGAQLATLNVRHFPMFPDLLAPFELPS